MLEGLAKIHKKFTGSQVVVNLVPDCSTKDEYYKLVRKKDNKFKTELSLHKSIQYLASLDTENPMFYRENCETNLLWEEKKDETLLEGVEIIKKHPIKGLYNETINTRSGQSSIEWIVKPEKGLKIVGAKPIRIEYTIEQTKQTNSLLRKLFDSDFDNITIESITAKYKGEEFHLGDRFDISCLTKTRVKEVTKKLRKSNYVGSIYLNDTTLYLDAVDSESELFSMEAPKHMRSMFVSPRHCLKELAEVKFFWDSWCKQAVLEDVLCEFKPKAINYKIHKEKHAKYWRTIDTRLEQTPEENTNIIYFAFFEHSNIVKIGRTRNWKTRENVYSHEQGKTEEISGVMTLVSYQPTKTTGDINVDEYLMFCSEDILKKYANSNKHLTKRKDLGIEFYEIDNSANLEDVCTGFIRVNSSCRKSI